MIKIPVPSVLVGAGMVRRFPEIIKLCEPGRVLIVTGKTSMRLGLLNSFLEALAENEIEYVIFDGVQPDPTVENIEAGLKVYKQNKCYGIVAFGGGSSIDCAKIIGARAANNMRIRKMKGLFKLRKKLPPFFAVPTTAGTGSEATGVGVVTDSSRHEKFAIMDPKLISVAAVLDPELTVSMPNFLTANTGMDALTHAIEAYIGWYDTAFVCEKALNATKIIINNLEKVYRDGENIALRQNMLLASFDAGVAFTRGYVGYVHAIAHNLGGLYGVPHGFANAVILPYVLEFQKDSIDKKLAELAVFSGIGENEEGVGVLADRFIEKIKEMNRNMEIPETIDALKPKDIPLLVKRVLKEGNPTYPVPKIMNSEECRRILEKLVTPVSRYF